MTEINFDVTKLTQALVKCKSITPEDDGALEVVQNHLSSQYDIDESLIISRLINKLDIAHLSTLLFDIDKNELSLKMAKECVNRLKNSYINKKIELCRQSLKNLDTDSEKFNETIMLISKLENDKNEIL